MSHPKNKLTEKHSYLNENYVGIAWVPTEGGKCRAPGKISVISGQLSVLSLSTVVRTAKPLN
jgi:hypothetical protein